LHLRDKKLQDSLLIYANAIKKRRIVEENLMQERTHLEDVSLAIQQLRASSFSSSSQSAFLSEVKRLNIQIKRLENELSEKLKQEEVVRQKYLQAKSDKDILVKLKERKKAHYFKEQIKLEQKMLDQVVSSRMNYKI
jgi:flagellar FliJ protein